jgi:hypothetical protein
MNKDNAKDFLPLVQALVDGKTIQCWRELAGAWGDLEDTIFNGPRKSYRVKPEEPKERYMTREEVLGFVANYEPGLVIRDSDSNPWQLPGAYGFAEHEIHFYEWATIDRDGTVGEPHKFI